MTLRSALEHKENDPFRSLRGTAHAEINRSGPRRESCRYSRCQAPHKWVGGTSLSTSSTYRWRSTGIIPPNPQSRPKPTRAKKAPPNPSPRQLRIKPPSQRMGKGPRRPRSLPTNESNATERRQLNAARTGRNRASVETAPTGPSWDRPAAPTAPKSTA